jgi:RecA-family ATPase
VTLADVPPIPIEWLWRQRIARGKLMIIGVDPGLGKSYFTADVTARCTRGATWPDGTLSQLGDVVILSAKDGLSDTIRPRIERLDGDLRRVHCIRNIRDAKGPRALNFVNDLDRVIEVFNRYHPIAMVVDPLNGYPGKTDSYKDSEVRSALTPLVRIAEEHNVALIGIMHLSKSELRSALHRVSGSVAFVAQARLVFALAQDPGDATRRILAPVVRQYSGRRANHVANASRTERSVGLATTLTT